MRGIVDLNNRAIARLKESRNDATAIRCLQEALCQLRKQSYQTRNSSSQLPDATTRQPSCDGCQRRPIKRSRQSSTDIVVKDENSTHIAESITFSVPIAGHQQNPKPRESLSSAVATNSPCVLSSSENLFSFYEQAFTVSLTGCAPVVHESTGDTTAKADSIAFSDYVVTRVHIILFYNVGLVYHQEGINSNTKHHLMKAQKFYQMALSMIAKEWITVEADDVLLMLAVSNNLGHIHSHLNNVQETKQFLVWLQEIMKSIQRCGKNIISSNDYTFFFTNTSVFEKLKELSCAPTA